MLRVPLSSVHHGPVETVGEIPANDPAFKGLDVELAAPVEVSGRLSSAGEEKYYWRVQFRTTVRGQCRRCLTSVEAPIDESRGVIFAADDETPEGDGCYVIDPGTKVLDLTEPLREEIFLSAPRFVECRPDCAGLCPRCGANLNDGPCGCPPETDARWDALKRPHDSTRKD
jgi:uncharacterized protein